MLELRMSSPDQDPIDREMMTRCIAVAVRSGEDGEYPYGVVIARGAEVVAELTNRVAHEQDVTRHAEVVAISQAQKSLGTQSLNDCAIYVNAEPCVYCCYAIRESRIGRVIYGLRSPHMGGVSKWNVLGDEGLSKLMPAVFDPPPDVVAGFMAEEVEDALLKWNPLVWGVVKAQGILVTGPVERLSCGEPTAVRNRSLRHRLLAFLRRTVFDRFGRRL